MTITDAMIEAGARAILTAQPGGFFWDNQAKSVKDKYRAVAKAALVAAEQAAWRPIEGADPSQAYLLYYPEMITGVHRQAKLPARVVVGYPGDSPNRPPTHFRPLPTPGEPDE